MAKQKLTVDELRFEAIRLMRSGLNAQAVRRRLHITYTKLVELTAGEALTLRKTNKSG